ncbi:MAG: hypothetical protein AAFZ80_04680 [Cyanobacteria bacterium P01_A01_bin.105]
MTDRFVWLGVAIASLTLSACGAPPASIDAAPPIPAEVSGGTVNGTAAQGTTLSDTAAPAAATKTQYQTQSSNGSSVSYGASSP